MTTKLPTVSQRQPTVQTFSRTEHWLKILAIILLVMGIFFRFSHLDAKFYWFDEVSTSVQVSGYGDSGSQKKLVTGQVISVADLQATQYPGPHTSVMGTVRGLASKEPQLTPLYFILARWWVQCFGNSVAVIRSLSAVFSVLAIPCLYWLCRELFRSPVAAWIAIALFAVSPLQLLYAQEARPSSFWILTLLLSSASLLRALRRQTVASWGFYAVTLVIGLYGHLFTLLVMAFHGVYVIIVQRLRLTRSLISYGVASAIAMLAFTPWIFGALIPYRQAMVGQSIRSPLPDMIKAWIRGVTLIFVDFSLNDSSPKLYFGLFLLLTIAILGGTGYCIYRVCRSVYRSTPRSTEWFIITAIAVPALLLVLSDFTTGASRSATARYMMPTYIGIVLAITYYFSRQFENPNLLQWQWQRQMHKMLILSLLSLGVLSCMAYSTSPLWWNKTDDALSQRYAQVINQASAPLLVSNAYFVQVVTLSYKLDAKVKALIVPESTLPKIPSGFSDIFFLSPNPETLEQLKPNFSVKMIESQLWKLTPK